jgi:glutamate carboxypeptidase
MSPPVPTGDLSPEELERALATLEALCAESSASGDRAGLERTSARLVAAFAARGFTCTREVDDAGGAPAPLFVARSPAGVRRPLLLLGHYDTVLDAAPPRREERALFATGAIDMKGGIAALLGALDLLARRGGPPISGLLVVLVPDEEVTGTISQRATNRFGAQARGCFVLEPGELLADGGETIVAGRRGADNFRLDLRGEAAHSGLAFWRGRSAVVAAARFVAEAAAFSKPDGLTVNPARVVGGERAFVEELSDHAGLLGSDRQLNVVPDRASVEGELRYLTAAEGEAGRARLAALALELTAATGVRLEIAFSAHVPPVAATAKRLAVAARAIDCAARRGWRLEVERDRGGISFPNFLPADLELPVLDGLGPAGGGMHTRDEFVELGSFARRVVLLADLLEAELAAG